jgi:hypothetical protein
MAGFYLALGNIEGNRIAKAGKFFEFFPEDEHSELFSDRYFSCVTVSQNDPFLFDSAYDEVTGVKVFCSGRIAWDSDQWSYARSLNQYNGGLSNKLILDQYLSKGITGVYRHNGSAILLIWDPRTLELHLLTDHFGYYPAYLYAAQNIDKCVISTMPDAIANDNTISVSTDYVSMAEFLRAWRITPPHTYYQEIKYAGAATHWCWNFSNQKVSSQTYWQPYQDESFPSLKIAIEELTNALTNAIKIRTLPHLGSVVSYTSGGLDSRAVLFACADRSQITALNLYEEFNQEAKVAKALCEASGVKYVGFARDNDYYPRWMQKGAKLSGGMWSLEDNHFLGTREFISQFNPKTVITACTSDWLFKGYGLEKKHQTLFGKNLPTLELIDERVDGFLPNRPRQAPSEFSDEINQRMLAWFDGTPKKLLSDRDYLLVEDKRVRPACYAVSVSGQIMYRIFPYDTFLADKEVANCYSRSRAEWKLNADLWAGAIANICREGGDIVDANFGWRVGSSYWQKIFMFGVGWVKRRIQKNEQLNKNSPATQGSWPNLSWYIQNSTSLHDFWNSRSPDDRDLISSLWGENCWGNPLDVWEKDPNSLFRLLTLLHHWESVKNKV